MPGTMLGTKDIVAKEMSYESLSLYFSERNING